MPNGVLRSITAGSKEGARVGASHIMADEAEAARDFQLVTTRIGCQMTAQLKSIDRLLCLPLKPLVL